MPDNQRRLWEVKNSKIVEYIAHCKAGWDFATLGQSYAGCFHLFPVFVLSLLLTGSSCHITRTDMSDQSEGVLYHHNWHDSDAVHISLP